MRKGGKKDGYKRPERKGRIRKGREENGGKKRADNISRKEKTDKKG